jgi:hypothetical protein
MILRQSRGIGYCSSMKRPIAVLIVAGIYLLVGVAGFSYHFPELTAGHPDAIAIELTELVALVCGVFLLLRHNWARWLALAWIVFHVIISFFHPLRELAMHAILCILIAWALFCPATARWFQRADSGS